jgi:hypothetical protein
MIRELVSAKFFHECAVPLMKEHDLSPERLVALMRQKRRELKELISLEGALFIIAKDRGVEFDLHRYDRMNETGDQLHSIDEIMRRLSV